MLKFAVNSSGLVTLQVYMITKRQMLLGTVGKFWKSQLFPD